MKTENRIKNQLGVGEWYWKFLQMLELTIDSFCPCQVLIEAFKAAFTGTEETSKLGHTVPICQQYMPFLVVLSVVSATPTTKSRPAQCTL